MHCDSLRILTITLGLTCRKTRPLFPTEHNPGPDLRQISHESLSLTRQISKGATFPRVGELVNVILKICFYVSKRTPTHVTHTLFTSWRHPDQNMSFGLLVFKCLVMQEYCTKTSNFETESNRDFHLKCFSVSLFTDSRITVTIGSSHATRISARLTKKNKKTLGNMIV